MYALNLPLFNVYARAWFPDDTNFYTFLVSVFFLMMTQKWPKYLWDDDDDGDDDDDDDDDDDNNNNNNNT